VDNLPPLLKSNPDGAEKIYPDLGKVSRNSYEPRLEDKVQELSRQVHTLQQNNLQTAVKQHYPDYINFNNVMISTAPSAPALPPRMSTMGAEAKKLKDRLVGKNVRVVKPKVTPGVHQMTKLPIQPLPFGGGTLGGIPSGTLSEDMLTSEDDYSCRFHSNLMHASKDLKCIMHDPSKMCFAEYTGRDLQIAKDVKYYQSKGIPLNRRGGNV
jgi:hypothetical protein